MLAYILIHATDHGKEYVQDIVIANMYYAYEIRNIVASEQYSPCERIRNRHTDALFEHSITRIDANICQNYQDTTLNEEANSNLLSIAWVN